MLWGSQAQTLPTTDATFAEAFVTVMLVAFTAMLQPVAEVVSPRIAEFTCTSSGVDAKPCAIVVVVAVPSPVRVHDL
jgi:hypothetical protein